MFSKSRHSAQIEFYDLDDDDDDSEPVHFSSCVVANATMSADGSIDTITLERCKRFDGKIGKSNKF
jgi:hypothetical protein